MHDDRHVHREWHRVPRATREETRELTITFDSNALPAGLPIWGFDSAFTSTTGNTSAGESETFTVTFQKSGRTVTLVATIDSATLRRRARRCR